MTTPEQAAHDAAPVVNRLGGAFMMDASTFARGAELGFDGYDFYVGGRGGALGDVAGEVAAAAMVFFAPSVVVPAWDRAGAVMGRRAAADAFIACGHEWARTHLPADSARIAELVGRIVSGAPVAGVPLFAAWRLVPEPTDAPALALHRLFLLRELRGALHGAAVLTVGVTPHEATAYRAPDFVGVFGWPDPHPETEPIRERWQLAEARTDRMVGRHFAALTATERTELVDLLHAWSPNP